MDRRERPHSFHLRLSDKELADLKNKSAKVGLKPQAYIHAVLNGKELKEMPSMDLINVLRTLSQINNSMYFIALNSNPEDPNHEAYEENVSMLRETIQELLEFMYGT